MNLYVSLVQSVSWGDVRSAMKSDWNSCCRGDESEDPQTTGWCSYPYIIYEKARVWRGQVIGNCFNWEHIQYTSTKR